MDFEEKYQNEILFALVIGSLYAAAGFFQFVLGTGLSGYLARFAAGTGLPGQGFQHTFVGFADALFIPADIPGGLVLLVVGATFLSGAKELRAGLPEGKAFVYVGTLLALTFALVYLFTMSGNALEAFVLGGEDFENWTFLSDMKPGIYLAALALPAYLSRKTRFTPGIAAGE